jgi:hypothetical protein
MTSLRSFIKQLINKQNFITVVSGLPRSGTSMMMSALEAGGLPLLTDRKRLADASNPKGYFEFEWVKRLPEGDSSWLDDARGKAVKIISALLAYLPDVYSYRVIFLERDLEEILASQARMLVRDGKEKQHPVSDQELRDSYIRHLEETRAWLAAQDWIETLYVSYNNTLREPSRTFQKVARFLGGHVSPEAMVKVIDENLYREREEKST